MGKKTILIVVGILLLLGIISAVVYFGFVQEAVVVTSTFVKPSWARLECSPTDAYESSYYKRLNEQSLFKCDGFTEECRFKITNDPPSSCLFKASGQYRVCDLNGEFCGAEVRYSQCDGESTEWRMIPSGKSIKFDTGLLVIGEDKTKITFEFKPWKLYRFVGGSKWIVNSYNCDITSGAKTKIRQEDMPITAQLFRQGGEGTKWINYVNDWNYGPPTNVFTHPSYGEVYCTAGQIFEIIDVRVADGTLKKLDPTYSATLPDGDVLKGLGARLAYVECCPNEPNCEDDFEYTPEPTDKECVSDIQCFNAGGPVPVDGTHYVVYKCINDVCVKSAPIEVECTTSAQCPAGEICDLSTMNYGKCITQIPKYCGDGICDITESFKTCPADCREEIECAWYEDYYETEKCGFLCILGLEEPVDVRGCKLSTWVYFVALGIFLAIIIIVLVVTRRIKRRLRR